MKCLVHPKLSVAINQAAGSKALAACAHLFVSYLYLKSGEQDDPRDYIPLSSTIGQRTYTTRHYGAVLTLLRSLKAVQTYRNGTYKRWESSKKYRLSEEFASGALPVVIDAPRLEARLEKVMAAESARAMRDAAHSWIVQAFRRASFAPTIGHALDEYEKSNPTNSERTRHLVELVGAHRMRFHVGRKSRRVFYPVVNLPKTIRAELLLDGEGVTEIDASGSQAMLLATLYREECEEKDRYLEMVRRDIYAAISGWVDVGWDRDRAKTEFFRQIAYGSRFNVKNYALLPIFERYFPQLAQIIAAIREREHGALSVMMQRLEASITIDGACGECAARGIPVLPVHDSLIVRTRDVETVTGVLAGHWKIRTGLVVTLRSVSDTLLPV